jgi:hypothetical protein
VSLLITDEHPHYTTEFRKILSPIASKSKIAYGDGAYDSRSNFNFLHSRGIDAVILPRENSSTLSRGSPYRAKIVRRIRNIGRDQWKNVFNHKKDGGWRYSSPH